MAPWPGFKALEESEDICHIPLIASGTPCLPFQELISAVALKFGGAGGKLGCQLLSALNSHDILRRTIYL